MWLRNCWYVIAWEHELADGAMVARTVLEEPILVYRGAHGVVALADRCAHRAAPLSKGRREGDAVRCGYHGLLFAADGRCVEAPGVASIPAKACVRTYPVVSHNRWVFVWMGEPALADPALLPDNGPCDDPDWVYKPGYLHYDTPYLLICDNLLDFSHLSYVHENTLGGATAIAQAPAKVARLAHGIRVERRVPDVPPPPFWTSFQTFAGNLDRWFDYDFLLPGTLLMSSGGVPAGQSPEDLTGGIEMRSCQTLTPETRNSTHYFFQQSHRSHITDPGVTQAIFDGLLRAFEEDRDMITAQHEALLQTPDVEMVAMPMDVALIQFRRLLQARQREEQLAPAPAAPRREATPA